MKILVIHGVGKAHDECEDLAGFQTRLAAATGASVDLWIWDSPKTEIRDPRNTWGWRWLRSFVHEAINDFAHISHNLERMVSELPDADVYIGNSAGGVLAYETRKPAILLGSPAQLVHNVKSLALRPVLNLMHYLDPIAAPVALADNQVIYSPMFLPLINPVKAHTSYWSSGVVMDKIVDWLGKL
jgi:hypothetical protein